MKKYVGTIIGGVVITAIVVWIVFYTVNNKRNNSVFSTAKTTNTEAEAIIDKDLTRFYPSSVKEVVKLYQRINVCLMSKTYTEDEFYKIVDQLRMLFDDELLAINPLDTYTTNLYDEILAFKSEKKTMSLTNIQLDSQVRYYTKNGSDYATIVGLFVVKNKKNIEKTYEKFVLREDSDGNWKILGWEKCDPVEFAD